jgi:hypothetical protein
MKLLERLLLLLELVMLLVMAMVLHCLKVSPSASFHFLENNCPPVPPVVSSF